MAEQQDKTKYHETIRLHGPVVDTMSAMGYGLMLDGETFYKLGYELDPYLSTVFNMHQAYEIHRGIEAAESRAKADAEARFEDAIKDLPDYVWSAVISRYHDADGGTMKIISIEHGKPECFTVLLSWRLSHNTRNRFGYLRLNYLHRSTLIGYRLKLLKEPKS